MEKREELVWRFLLSAKGEPLENLANKAAMSCGVTESYAQGIIDRIGTPWEVLYDGNAKAIAMHSLKETTLSLMAAVDEESEKYASPGQVHNKPRDEKPERVKLMEAGIKATAGDRNKTYGNPWDNMTNTAQLFEAYLDAKYGLGTKLVGEDVAHLMQLVKIARTFNTGYHADSYTDNAAYGAIAGECRKTEEGL